MKIFRILIVEDESIIALDIESQLIEAGYAVVQHVPSGAEAIQQATALRPDLVLMDIKLSGPMDGIEAANIIQQTLNIPTVYLTSHSDETLLQRAQTTEPYGYLLKPFGSRELHSTIQMALYRHRAETKLRESETRLAAFVSVMPDLACVLDKNGKVTELLPQQNNPLYHEISQLNEQGLLFSPQATTIIAAAVEQTIQTGSPQVIEYQLQLAGGLRWFEGNASPMPTDIGQPERAVLLSRDITQRKQNENQLKIYQGSLEQEVDTRTRALREIIAHLKTAYAERVEAENALSEAHQHLQELDQLKDNFMSGVSHELRTPIANLKIYHHLLRNNPDKSAKYLKALEQSTQRLETIVEQMLYITRMYRELDTLTLAPVDLNQLVEKALPEHSEALKKGDLHFSFVPQHDLPVINGDAKLLTRVLHNLITNAVNYTQDEGQITITTAVRQTANNKTVLLSVSNPSPQIPDEELSLIFERFYRGHAALQYGIPGAGLGLYVAQMIVERHGGEIDARNDVVDGEPQITFTISFVCEDEDSSLIT